MELYMAMGDIPHYLNEVEAGLSAAQFYLQTTNDKVHRLEKKTDGAFIKLKAPCNRQKPLLKILYH
jgi:hypothetical protein